MQWPGSICNSEDVGVFCEPYTGKPAEDFLVQDLQTWAVLLGFSTIRVESCSNRRFYINAINGTVRNAMREYWTTLECPSTSPVPMWNATWLASGTCSGGNETVFFKTGLDIAKQANMLGGLREYGIVQSDTEIYPLDNVRMALQKSVGKNVVITCNKNRDGKSQIYNVHVCANKEGSALIDCPHNDSSCPQLVMFPVFNTSMLNDTSANTVHLEMVL
ncbi:hypothetical protein ACLOJK_031861 [Asimina triloba]